MTTWKRQKEDPSEYLDHYKNLGYNVNHITFDEKLDCDFRRRVQSTHDGTLMFIRESIDRLFMPLIKMQSYSKKEPINEGVKRIEYKIGKLYQFNIFSKYNINGHIMFGQRDRIMIPVKCTLIY